MKKIFKLMLVLALVITQFIGIAPVSAAETTGSITINTPDGETKDGAINYNIYKVFDLSLNGDENTQATAYRYTIRKDSKWYNFFNEGAGRAYVELTPSVDDEDGVPVYVVTWIGSTEETNKAQLAKDALAYAKVTTNNVEVTETATIAQGGTTTTVYDLELGYYLVDSSLGSLCALTTTDRNAEINEKNFIPTVKKEVEETTNNKTDESYAKIGDTVNYKTTITVAAGAINYELHDKMEEGLTFDDKSVEIKVGDKVLVSGTDYTLTSPYGNETFLIKFNNETIKGLKVGDKIVVTYSATLNEKAEIKDESNDNTTYLKYGDETEFKSEDSTTKTYSYSFDLVKTDSENELLEGAKFRLYDAETEGNEIKLVKESDGVYRVAMPNEAGAGVEIEGSQATIKGLDGNTIYWLEETVAPEGYNKLTVRQKVKIETDNLEAEIKLENGKNTINGGIHVVNNTGTELPETGGMGTVMFITVGSLMVMGFGVLLVTKLRLSKES